VFIDPGDAGARLIEHVERQMRAAAAEQRYERATWLRRRARRLGVILERLDGVLEAIHARARLILAPHPTNERFDAFWLAGGRLVDWGPLPDLSELHGRTRAALTRGVRAGELGGYIPPDEIDEVRIIASYLASHPGTPKLVLDAPEPDPATLERFVQENGSSTTSAVTPA
jgi:DNA polymerase-3 subunit epsilon